MNESISPPSGKSFAGLLRRLPAAFIDMVLAILSSMVVSLVFGIVLGLIYAQSGLPRETLKVNAALAGYMIWILWTFFYFAVFESSKWSATPGKMLLKMRVLTVDGGRISFGQATRRHFSKILSVITLLAGLIWVQLNSKRQALHDMLSDTVVVRV